jgi:DEAD/DEAH box helicase domain-containing protein
MPLRLVFDLETKRLANQVGGWSNIEKMGFAAGVTYNIDSGQFSRYTEDQVEGLISSINSADLIVGFNLIRFDFTVLKPYGLQLDQALLHKSVDLLDVIHSTLGFRLGLANLARATLGETKSADGVESVRWYEEGEIEKVLDYCEQDVRVTYQLWRYGINNGHVYYLDRRGNKIRVRINWRGDSSPLSD